MHYLKGNVDFRKAVEGNSRQREEAINAAYLFINSRAALYSSDVVRVNPYQEILFTKPRHDVEGATYAGNANGTLVVLAVRHYRNWHRDGQKYIGKLAFDLFVQSEGSYRGKNLGDFLRKGILQAVRNVRKRC